MSKRRSIADQVGSEPVDVLARRPSKAKRDRSWEKRHEHLVVTYRGVPPELQEQLKAVARQVGVTVGEVARAFLEYGLDAYEKGELELDPVLLTGKYSLFPGGVSPRDSR